MTPELRVAGRQMATVGMKIFWCGDVSGIVLHNRTLCNRTQVAEPVTFSYVYE